MDGTHELLTTAIYFLENIDYIYFLAYIRNNLKKKNSQSAVVGLTIYDSIDCNSILNELNTNLIALPVCCFFDCFYCRDCGQL